MKRRKKSDIWSQFTADDSEKMASCHICKQALSYKTSITNLRRHLTSKHPSYSIRLSEITSDIIPQKNEDDNVRKHQESIEKFFDTKSTLEDPLSDQVVVHTTNRAKSHELAEASSLMKTACHTVNNIINRKNKDEDECELFGKLVAKKLKKFPEIERTEVMYEIHGLLLQRYRSLTSESEQQQEHVQTEIEIQHMPCIAPTTPSNNETTLQ